MCWSGWQTIGHRKWQEMDFAEDNSAEQPKMPRMTLWLILAAAPSIMLLATTNLMCQEVASVPFLWILPLTLYLLSLIICFDRPEFYKRSIFLPLLILSVIVAVLLVQIGNRASL